MLYRTRDPTRTNGGPRPVRRHLLSEETLHRRRSATSSTVRRWPTPAPSKETTSRPIFAIAFFLGTNGSHFLGEPRFCLQMA
jgi:hypothetical protein